MKNTERNRIELFPAIKLEDYEMPAYSHPRIKNKVIEKFFGDFEKILEGYDHEINFKTNLMVKWDPRTFWSKPLIVFKGWQVRENPHKRGEDNVLRHYHIFYNRNFPAERAPAFISGEEISSGLITNLRLHVSGDTPNPNGLFRDISKLGNVSTDYIQRKGIID